MKSINVICICALLAAGSASAQYWQGPVQLTVNSGQDVRPAVCKEWILPNMTCLVWQTNRNGNWDVFSRFCSHSPGDGWLAEEPVTLSRSDDINPAVACCNDLHDSPSYWCVWERVEGPVTSSIRAAFYTWRDQWRDTAQIALVVHGPGEDCEPGIVVLKGYSRDTAWATWLGHDTDGYHIGYAYHDSTAWSRPGIAHSSPEPLSHPRIGRGRVRNRCCPLLVWEQNGNIYLSHYLDGTWTAPTSVAPSPAQDIEPSVIDQNLFLGMGPWIVWQSNRDGSPGIYATSPDSLHTAWRWCDSASAGNNTAPAGIGVTFPVDDHESAIAVWVSDRSGNPDIYSNCRLFSGQDVPVNLDPALDSAPTLTAMGATEVWCCWQSNRSGNWDIWGSFILASGVSEGRAIPALSRPSLQARPNPFRDGTTIVLTAYPGRLRSSAVQIRKVTGKLVRTLPLGNSRLPNSCEIFWDGTDDHGRRLPCGVYHALATGAPSVPAARIIRD